MKGRLPSLLIVTILLLLWADMLSAQQFGGNPPSVRWRHLKTDSIEVIYPARTSMDSTAVRIAQMIGSLQKAKNYRLGDRQQNVPIVLQTQTTNSNGYVGLGPYRSEFYLSAPMDVMDLGSIDWATTLSLHEYRHVLQYNNINRGVTRVADWLLGDNARSLLSDVAVPNWFFEGDAVFSETLHSTQGRGRLPRFVNVYSVLAKDGKIYHYEKLRNGSYKDYIPGHYELGYLLVCYGYRHYGPDFWGKVIRDAAKYKGLFYPFQQAIKRNAGVSFKHFREAAWKEYLREFQNIDRSGQATGLADSNSVTLTRLSDQEVINYMYPYPAGPGMGGGIIALKSPSKSNSRFVYVNDGQQRDLGEAPIARDGYFGYNAGIIIYTRYQVDPRWNYKEYSDLEVLDIRSGKRQRVTYKGRYFTPDISANGRLLAASELQTDGCSSIVVLDRTGRVLLKYTAPTGTIYNYPKFFVVQNNGDQDTALLFLTRQADGRMGIGAVKLRMSVNPVLSTSIDLLLPKTCQLLAFPVVRNKKLYYSMIRPGNTDPYTLLMELNLSDAFNSDTIQPVIIGRTVRDVYQGYGTDAAMGKHGIIASLQTANGYGLFRWQKGSLGLSQKIESAKDIYLPRGGYSLLSNGRKSNADTSKKAVILSGFPILSVGKTDGSFLPQRYPLLSHPFHFHSLQPSVEDPVYSLDLLGQNLLNTVQTKLSYSYNRVTEISAAGADFTLGFWYLQPYVHMDYSWEHKAADRQNHQYSYKELTSQLGIQLPLNFTGGRWQRSLYLATALSQSNLYWQQPAPGSVLEQIRYLYSRAQLSMYARQSSRQLYPRLGLYIYTEMNTPLDGKGTRQWMNSTTIYLPGVMATHSLRWNLAYQHRDTAGAYGYNSRFPFSRGYVRPSYTTMWKFGADYDLPIWYPDFGFAGMAYFSRIRANVYYDQSYGFDSRGKRNAFGSVGGAIFADMNIGNQYPITIGLRYNHLLNSNFLQKNNWELILPIHLF